MLCTVAGVKLEPASSPGGHEPWRAVIWTSPEVEDLLRWLRDPEVYTWLDLEGVSYLSECVVETLLPFMGKSKATQREAIMEPLPWIHHCLDIASPVVQYCRLSGGRVLPH
ncbi:hypothetical protein AAFF_G00144080 [Aldrovandia affinis]|uniref:Uncharacterized protein n=1 Tax=Aldrovandia affinis TaxID=143900 RepID=A0AAD7T0H7_9TELE|nr:hypothetical protein AAFF_G00144080 [Aldrovandia affinis]